MRIKKKKSKGESIQVEATANAAEVDKAFEIAEEAFARQIGVSHDDSRPVQEVAEEKLGIENLDDVLHIQVVEYLVPFAIDKSGIMPDFPPEPVAPTKAERGKPYTFTIDIMPKPALELSSYDPVTITVPPFELDEEALEDQLAQMADSYAEFESIEPRPAQEGDSCLLDIRAEKDSQQLAELTTENAIYLLGSSLYGDDFDRNITGMEAGETRTFEIEHPHFAGGEGPDGGMVECTVTLTEVRKKVAPTIDDEWIKENIPSLGSVDDFKELLREEFKRSYAPDFEDEKRRQACMVLASRLEGPIRDEAFEAMKQTLLNNLKMQLRRQGSDLEKHIEDNGGAKSFDLQLLMQAREALTQGYALDALFRHEKMSLTDNDILEACKTMDSGQPQIVRRQMELAGCGFTLRETAQRLKASKWLVENAEVVVEQE